VNNKQKNLLKKTKKTKNQKNKLKGVYVAT